MRTAWPLLALAASCAACSSGGPGPMPALAGISQVELKGEGGKLVIATITEPAKIEALVAFVNARRDGWGTPWHGVPVPRVRADFRGAEFQGNFGAGPGFFTTHRAGGFWSRDASEEDLAEFARLAGVPLASIR